MKTLLITFLFFFPTTEKFDGFKIYKTFKADGMNYTIISVDGKTCITEHRTKKIKWSGGLGISIRCDEPPKLLKGGRR